MGCARNTKAKSAVTDGFPEDMNEMPPVLGPTPSRIPDSAIQNSEQARNQKSSLSEEVPKHGKHDVYGEERMSKQFPSKEEVKEEIPDDKVMPG